MGGRGRLGRPRGPETSSACRFGSAGMRGSAPGRHGPLAAGGPGSMTAILGGVTAGWMKGVPSEMEVLEECGQFPHQKNGGKKTSAHFLYLYIHIYTHLHTHTCIYTSIHAYIHIYIYTYIHTCIHLCTYTYIYIFELSRQHLKAFMWAHSYFKASLFIVESL